MKKRATALLLIVLAIPAIALAKRKPVNVEKEYPFHFVVVSTSYINGVGCSMHIEVDGANGRTGAQWLVSPLVGAPCKSAGTKLRGGHIQAMHPYSNNEGSNPILINLLWYVDSFKEFIGDSAHAQIGLYQVDAQF
jgi:hypothetical protein